MVRFTIFSSKIIKIILDNAYILVQFNKRGKYQEWIQSSTTPDTGYHMEKWQIHNLTTQTRGRRLAIKIISWSITIKVSKKATIRNRYNQAQHLAQEPHGKVTKTQETPHAREPLSQEVSPFPAMTTRLQWIDKKAWQTQNKNNQNNPQKKHHLRSVSKNIFHGRLKLILWYQPHPYFRCGSRQIYDWFPWKILTYRCKIYY